MKIRFVVGARASHQQQYASALAKGIRLCGYKDVQINTAFNQAEKPDVVITWAYKRPDVINYCKTYNKRHLVMERAYIGERHVWVSLGFDGLNGRANFNNKHITSSDRFEKHFNAYDKPFRIKEDGVVVVCGQVEGDASHKHININNWYHQVINQLNKMGLEVIFRPHPLSKNEAIQHLKGLKYTLDGNVRLEDTLKDARCCVTFSSNSGVISALEGVPVVAFDEGAMAYEIASHDLSNLDYTPDKQQWLNQLAYCQWLPEELENGEAFKHLKEVIEA